MNRGHQWAFGHIYIDIPQLSGFHSHVYFPPSILVDTFNYNMAVHYPDTGPYGMPDISLILLEY
jgi:hypothetical protein